MRKINILRTIIISSGLLILILILSYYVLQGKLFNFSTKYTTYQYSKELKSVVPMQYTFYFNKGDDSDKTIIINSLVNVQHSVKNVVHGLKSNTENDNMLNYSYKDTYLIDEPIIIYPEHGKNYKAYNFSRQSVFFNCYDCSFEKNTSTVRFGIIEKKYTPISGEKAVYLIIDSPIENDEFLKPSEPATKTRHNTLPITNFLIG